MAELYLEPGSAVENDLLVGLLLELGLPEEEVERLLAPLAPALQWRLGRVHLNGNRSGRFWIGWGAGRPEPRTRKEVEDTLRQVPLPEEVAGRLAALLNLLAEAQESATGSTEGAFAALGGMREWATLMVVCHGFWRLGIKTLFTHPLPLGSSPSPLAAWLLRGLPVRSGGRGVGVGAALLLKGFGARALPATPFTYQQVGSGARPTPEGMRLQGYLATARPGIPLTRLTARMLTVNLEHTPPEQTGYLLTRLLEAGARDAWATAVTLPGGKPAMRLSVLAPPDRFGALRALLLQESHAPAVGAWPLLTWRLPTRVERVKTRFGWIPVRRTLRSLGFVSVVPRPEECREAARRHGVPALEVEEAARHAAQEQER